MPEFHKVCKKSDVPLTKGKTVLVADKRIAVFNLAGTFYAIDDGCTHADASLAEGGLIVEECAVECPWHGAQFDIKTGKAKTLPAVEPVATYRTRVTGDDVEVEV